MRKALLLINLGTPNSTDPKDVGKYLTEFLTDKHVIDLPYLIRHFLVRALIVPSRKIESAKKYKKVWLKEGSPLLVHTQNLTSKLDSALKQYDVFFAMRYGEPSIPNMLEKIKDYDAIEVLPLYPHDTKSSITTASEATLKAAKDLGIHSKISIIKPFFEKDFYIQRIDIAHLHLFGHVSLVITHARQKSHKLIAQIIHKLNLSIIEHNYPFL